ncbi:MAG: type II toxin-antitoxin system RelE/ParE family toxin [Devosia sp.]|nr:type II toxin-antitoxin system RelE/ParE family toxin [Devosia sp.]
MDEWDVRFHPDFVPEFRDLDDEVKVAVGEVFDELRDKGPFLGRPEVDTLNGSRHRNMKEIRVDAANGVWRFAFAFDAEQRAIVLCGGDKSGLISDRFYKRLIERADARFDEWLKGD